VVAVEAEDGAAKTMPHTLPMIRQWYEAFDSGSAKPDILKRYFRHGSGDLAELDPPFNSAQNDKAGFQEKDGNVTAIAKR